MTFKHAVVVDANMNHFLLVGTKVKVYDVPCEDADGLKLYTCTGEDGKFHGLIQFLEEHEFQYVV